MSRPGFNPKAHEWRECPRCRTPMVRWDSFQRHPERVWVNWNPEDWPVSPLVVMLAALLLIGAVSPALGEWLMQGSGPRSGTRTFNFMMGVGALLATAYAVVVWWRRGQKRKALAQGLKPQDWICPNCLHTVAEQRP